MKNRHRLIFAALVAVVALGAAILLSSRIARVSATTPACVAGGAQECSKCEGYCKSWVDKCKEGGQYACYKAASCLCKCNLDAGGCGSDRNALKECYEKNEKLAKDLESRPPQAK